MFSQGLFKAVSLQGDVLVCPTDDLPARCRAVSALFELLDQAGRTLEGSTYCTMSFVPAISREVLKALGDDSNDRGQPPLFGNVRRALSAAAEQRLLPLLKPSSPAIISALLHPLMGVSVMDVVSVPAAARAVAHEDRRDDACMAGLQEAISICADWYAHISEAAEDKRKAGEAASEDRPREPVALDDSGGNGSLASAAKLRRLLGQDNPHAVRQHVGGGGGDGDDDGDGGLVLGAGDDDGGDDVVLRADNEERELQARKRLFEAYKVEGHANIRKVLYHFTLGEHIRSFQAPSQFLRPLSVLLQSDRDRDEPNEFVAANPASTAQQTLADFFNGATIKGLELDGGMNGVKRICLLARCVMSTTAMSSVVESVFSLAGLIDTPRRSRMLPWNFEKLLVASYAVQQVKAKARAAPNRKAKEQVINAFVDRCLGKKFAPK
jgi:hypothetical protein